jgi:hypothetical protein
MRQPAAFDTVPEESAVTFEKNSISAFKPIYRLFPL